MENLKELNGDFAANASAVLADNNEVLPSQGSGLRRGLGNAGKT